MRKEIGEFTDQNFVSERFLLPDGLNCEWIFKRNDTYYGDLLKLGTSAFNKVAFHGGEIRVSSESESEIGALGSYLKHNFKGAYINWGKTTFFEHDLRSSQPFQEDFPDFEVDRVTGSEEEIDVLKSLMIGSFKGEQVERALNDQTNNIYLVSDQNGFFVGSFLLKYIYDLDEVQLHSVAGLSNHPHVLQIKRKLPILMGKMFEVIDPSAKKLTFSSSGAAHLYEELGFQKSNRSGLVIKS